MPRAEAGSEVAWREVLAILDEEVQKLSPRQRGAFVLCILEGKSREEAARQLGWKEGTLRGTLTRAREQLRCRLARRGVTLSAVLSGMALSRESSAPAALSEGTFRAALAFATGDAAGSVSPHVASLAREATRSLVAVKLPIAAVVLAAVVVVTGVAGFVRQQLEGKQETGVEKAVRSEDQPKPAEDPLGRADRYGDPLPTAALARMGTTRLRHGEIVHGLDFSPDGKLIAAGGNFYSGDDQAIYLWEAADGRLLRQCRGHGHSISKLAFSPDGKTLASVGRDKTIRLWDVGTAKEVRRIAVENAHDVLAFSPDGKRLATTCYSIEGHPIIIWDPATGKELLRLRGHKELTSSLTFAPDGKTLASAGTGPNLILWDVASGKELRRIDIGKIDKYWRPIAFTPDGRQLAAGHADNSLRLWDVATGAEVRAFRGHRQPAMRLVFSTDGKALTSAAEDRTVRFWDATTAAERRAVPIPVTSYTFAWVAFSPGEKMLAVGGVDNAIRLWDLQNGKEIHPAGHQAPVAALAFSPDGKALTSVSWDRTFRRWDAASGREMRRSGELKATLLSVPLLAKSQEYFADPLMIYAACLSADGRLLATGEGSNDARIHLWDVAGGKEIRSFASDTGSVIALAFSPDGRVVASGSWDKTVRLWDVATGKELRRLTGHGASIYSVCFSADGRWLASAGGDRTVRVWEVATGKQRHCLRHETSVFAAAFSADGRMLAAAGGQYANEPPGYNGIVLWEMASGEERRRLGGQQRVVAPLAISPDGRFLVSGGSDGMVRVWEPLTGKERGRFSGGQGLVKSLAFSSDGRRLASGGSDTTVLVWDMARLSAGAAQAGQLRTEDEEALFRDLAGADARRAYQAMARLAAFPGAAGLLKARLRPAAPADAQKIARWISELDSESFAAREQASAELAKLGDRAGSALHQALAKSPSLEARRRMEALLSKLSHPSPELLFSLRAVEVLEHAHTPQALEVLRELAAGAPEARLTQEAKESLGRLVSNVNREP